MLGKSETILMKNQQIYNGKLKIESGKLKTENFLWCESSGNCMQLVTGEAMPRIVNY